jgi:hypothetical protein
MSNNKQSSVELFIEQLEEKGNAWENGSIHGSRLNISIDVSVYKELKEQAKAMHKKEIKDAFNQGYRDGEHDYGNTTQILGDVSVWDDSENYYNETFGGNK